MTDITDPETYGEFMHQLALTSPFRRLSGKENEAVSLIDCRDMSKPNNDVFITAPHSSNNMKESKMEPYDMMAVSSQMGFDIGAFEVSTELAEKLECM